jgi:hypothetical protein
MGERVVLVCSLCHAVVLSRSSWRCWRASMIAKAKALCAVMNLFALR